MVLFVEDGGLFDFRLRAVLGGFVSPIGTILLFVFLKVIDEH